MGKQPVGHGGSDSIVDPGLNAAIGADVGAVDTTAIADAEPPKRGGWPKGKPRGGNSGGGRGTGGGNSGGASTRAEGSKAKATQLDLTGIAGALAGIHMGIAMMSKHEHWELSDVEAEAMAKSVVNVARHYPKVASSQKLIDWTMLFGSLGMIYFPRAMESKALLEKKRKEKANAE